MFTLRGFGRLISTQNCCNVYRQVSAFERAQFKVLRNTDITGCLRRGNVHVIQAVNQFKMNPSDTHTQAIEMTEETAKLNTDMACPNTEWLPESIELFDKLTKMTESGDWKKLPSYSSGKMTKALFSRTPCVGRPGQLMEYAFFASKKERKLLGVCQFGPMAEGPPGHVHGGAIATMLDASAGVLSHYAVEGVKLTANMNINYRRPTPLLTTFLVEAQVEEVEGRKTKLSSKIKSADGETLLVDASLLFISIDISKIVK